MHEREDRMKKQPVVLLTPDVLRRKGVMKGFEYLSPERTEIVREIENRFKMVGESFGFREIEGPLLQPIEFYQVKSGEELLTRTYTFKDADNSLLVLRPELTPTVAYMIAKDDARLTFPLKWWSNPDLFRKEKPQKGRKRQFKQLNVDIFDRADSGRQRSFDDAEVIAVAVSIFKSFGLTEDDIVMRINSRSLVEKLFDRMNLDKKQRSNVLFLVDKSAKIATKEFKTKLEEIIPQVYSRELLQRLLSIKSLEEIVPDELLGFLGQSKEYKDLVRVFDLIEAYSMSGYCEFSPDIVRGLGYYTGTVFEAFDRKTKYGFRRALMGGGRYDNLTKDMGGKLDITGVGFGFGNVPLEEILLSRSMEVVGPESQVDYFVIIQSVEQQIDAIKISQELRQQGKNVILDDSVSKQKPDKVTKQLSRSNKLKAKYSLLVFPEEWKEGKVVVKDMQTGEQSVIEIRELSESKPKSH